MSLRKHTLAAAFLSTAFGAGAAYADGTDCVVYATDYANQYVGSGDPIGDAVSGGMAGAVVGDIIGGPGGANAGAKAGGALGILDNLGSLPGGWDALYDMAYQMCVQQDAGLNPNLLYPAPVPGTSHYPCRSTATVNGPSIRSGPGGTLSAGSGRTGCQ